MIERLTCDQVRERDLVERYVPGKLTEPEAESLEAHVLECEACWRDLQEAIEFNPALSGTPQATHVTAPPVSTERRRPAYQLLLGTLAAAAVLILAAGAWLTTRPPADDVGVTRGSETISVTTKWEPHGGLRVDWDPVPGATLYQLRVIASGTAGATQRLTQPGVTVSAADLVGATDVLVEVEAEGATGEVLARGQATPEPRR